MTRRHIYLAKESDRLISHCSCDRTLITYPPQLDCPWCGCGWLFACIECRKAFTFARGIETDEPWHDLARKDLFLNTGVEPNDLDVQQWVNVMRGLMADVEPGETYVVLDGCFVPADAAGIEIDGWVARHELDFVPQVAALEDPGIIDSMLANREYWLSHALPEGEDEGEGEG